MKRRRGRVSLQHAFSLDFWDLLGWTYGQIYSYQLKFVTQEFVSRAMSAVGVKSTFMPRFSHAQVLVGLMFFA